MLFRWKPFYTSELRSNKSLYFFLVCFTFHVCLVCVISLLHNPLAYHHDGRNPIEEKWNKTPLLCHSDQINWSDQSPCNGSFTFARRGVTSIYWQGPKESLSFLHGICAYPAEWKCISLPPLFCCCSSRIFYSLSRGIRITCLMLVVTASCTSMQIVCKVCGRFKLWGFCGTLKLLRQKYSTSVPWKRTLYFRTYQRFMNLGTYQVVS